jgi:predicted PolB exonuclease-like 3'-5' exonuclease
LGAKFFTALDLCGAYNLIRMKKGKEWKTAFRTRYGYYKYMVMPFRLTNALAVCQALINNVLQEHLDITIVAYLNDILVYSQTLEEHKVYVR